MRLPPVLRELLPAALAAVEGLGEEEESHLMLLFIMRLRTLLRVRTTREAADPG